MSWLRTDITVWNKWANPTPRNIWWLRKEVTKIMKKIDSQGALSINTNASLWKWVFDFLYAIFNWRINNAVKYATMWRHSTRAQRNKHFDLFVNESTKRYLGVEMVVAYGVDRCYPKKIMHGVRDSQYNLRWLPKNQFMEYRDLGEIRWCSINNDFFFASAFQSVFDWKKDKAVFVEVAGHTAFICPMCGSAWLDRIHNKVKNKFLGTIVCPQCVTKKVSNRPHTVDSVYGEYHSHARGGWKFFDVLAENDSTIPMGIELEMQFKGNHSLFNPRSEAWSLYEYQITHDKDWNLFYCERDGSIGEFGMELITMPMSLHLHYQFWNLMLPKIRDRFSGWKTEKHSGGQYGIHITFDINKFGQFNLARLAKFLDDADNRIFVQGIAQRGIIYQAPEALCTKTKSLSNIFAILDKKIAASANRNQPINIKAGQLAEIRMFNSTLNTVSFYKNLEFLHAFRHWCTETPYSPKAEKFVDWLEQGYVTLYPLYPYLYQYLTKERFPVKYAKWSCDNPYYKTFKRLVDKQIIAQRDLFDPDAHLRDTTDAN